MAIYDEGIYLVILINLEELQLNIPSPLFCQSKIYKIYKPVDDKIMWNFEEI